MKKLIFNFTCAIACCLGNPMAAESSELDASLKQFCNAAKTLNNSGLSIAPGTQVGKAIQQKANQSAATYQVVFAMAKNSYCPNLY